MLNFALWNHIVSFIFWFQEKIYVVNHLFFQVVVVFSFYEKTICACVVINEWEWTIDMVLTYGVANENRFPNRHAPALARFLAVAQRVCDTTSRTRWRSWLPLYFSMFILFQLNLEMLKCFIYLYIMYT